MDNVWSIYKSLWERAQSERVVVRYQGMWPDFAGHFDARDEEKKPVLMLYRQRYKSPSTSPSRELNDGTPVTLPELTKELITFAHEYGHFQSYGGRTARDEWLQYMAAVRQFEQIRDDETNRLPDGLDKNERNDRVRAGMHARLDADARARILREEALAWEIGREVLLDLGLTDLAAYDDRTRMSLHFYRYRFGLEELWPEDDRASASSEE